MSFHSLDFWRGFYLFKTITGNTIVALLCAISGNTVEIKC